MAEAASATTKPEIAHVLTMDVVGYSKLLLDDQTQLMSRLNRVVKESARVRDADKAGKLIRLTTGDGMALVFFDEPEAALESAVEITAALKTHPDIQIRMGLHSGPVRRVFDVNDQPNVAGAGIDMAQRVMDCGEGGHILLSKRFASDFAPMARWHGHLHDLGEAEVKHGEKIGLVNFYNESIGNPTLPEKLKTRGPDWTGRKPAWLGQGAIAIAALLVAGVIGGWFYLERSRLGSAESISPPDKSIAVMPFADLSQTHDQEYFCDGISEEILDALAKVEGLRVVARTSTFSFKGKNADVGEIGRKLNVATVLEGSLRRDGDRIRVTAQLVDARNGFHIWSDTIEKQMQSVFALQDEITRAIVDALKINLTSAPRARSQKNTEAYDLYLQGLFFSNKSDEASLRKSLDLFQHALDRDATLARAWTGIAKDWNWLADAYVRPLEGHPLCQAAARKALALDERDAEAHAYLSEELRILDYDLQGQKSELDRALEIDPNSAAAHLFMALCLTETGDRQAGLKEIQTAIHLDPLSPIIGSLAVVIFLGDDRLDEALAEAKRTAEIDPNYVYFEPSLATVYREQGKLSEALELYRRAEQTTGRASAGLAITYARLGQTDEARRILSQLIQAANTGYFPGEAIASVYVALGENEEAIRWLNRAVKDHAGAIHDIGYDRSFRPLHSDPRFADILRRIGLDPAKTLHPR